MQTTPTVGVAPELVIAVCVVAVVFVVLLVREIRSYTAMQRKHQRRLYGKDDDGGPQEEAPATPSYREW
ncbi:MULTISPECIES: hypothetical protein [unclassified Rhodococcus (in: high G+C Gram-positive bacteria)]|uniref:hypothetical protein n=1 Tax=unclassified Rhodococcus (in: high G+C Gram-positive bacteria) TaxID=192944 RepID=UPI000E0A4C8A|nr:MULTISPECIES: hypothetical protein [unclassified Rhodococcus (in: high G+C Gram-positive bacteria)]QKT12965.1 hypothetical protein HUN07_21620 [Rhodococcus sp. W8901]RDI33754.1 hypothetical protein DEU38_102109 [Rhodococcus sp. AG1013]